MPLELATSLILRNADDGSPLSLASVKQIAAAWADVSAAATEVVENALGRGGRVTTRESILASDPRRWDLTLARVDDGDPSVEWVVELTALSEPDRTTTVVRLRRESSDHRLRPLSGAPAPPGFARSTASSGLRMCRASSTPGSSRRTVGYRSLLWRYPEAGLKES